MRPLAFLFCAVVTAVSQANKDPNPYLFRISHETPYNYSCALLQKDGAFHLEFARGDNIKVFEGAIDSAQLLRIRQVLDSPPIVTLSLEQIEEPLLRSWNEKLQLTIYRHDYSQELFFESIESEKPFKEPLNFLVRWLDGLPRLPHKEFSEDEGKQNCLPRTEIVLKKRDPNSPPPPVFVPPSSGPRSALNPPPLAPARTAEPSFVPLLRVDSFAMNGGDARQFCVLVANDGRYRFENRVQKSRKPVNTAIRAGTLGAEQITDLRKVLDAPSLAKIRHREPRNLVVPILGDILNLSIMRPEGEQKITLTSGFGREVGTVYGGDADISAARDLTRFLREQIEQSEAGTSLDKSARNGCTDLP